ncbi:MAG TPA: DNA polymerase I [Flavobacteriaceae bacterium]|nr:DNA polymerase I [Flavobacteriaceae bacterium]
MNNQKRLFLLDAYALIFRGYYALIKNPIVNSKGQDTSAIMGFMNTLFDVIRREKPDHLAVAFDKDGSTERSELFDEYKANRPPTPDAIKEAVPIIQDILRAMNIPVIELSGLEADDLIGTLAKQAEKEGYQVFMVTPDKDFAQLVSENIFMYRPARMGNGIDIWGVPEVQERFGVERPEQVIDFLGMMGDASDNIPGLPGVGEKTAKKFIAEYGSMENLLANTHQLTGKMKERIEEHAELGRLSKKLATIYTDCDVVFDEKDFELTMPDGEKVQIIFEELEFRRLKDQFLNLFSVEGTAQIKPSGKTTVQTVSGVTITAGSGQFSLFDSEGEGVSLIEDINTRATISTTPHFYQLVKPGLSQKLFLEELFSQKSVCIDIISNSDNCLEAELVGMAFSWKKGTGFYYSFSSDSKEFEAELLQLRKFFENPEVEIIGQNLKNDLKVMAKYGISFEGKLFDTMIAHYLINPDMRHDLHVLSETYLNYTPIDFTEIIGKGKNKIPISEVSKESIMQYAVENADIIHQLKQHFELELNDAGTMDLFNTLEIPLLRVLAAMELEGINLDVDFLNHLSAALEKDIQELEERIYSEAGERFNISSPKQLGDILFGKLKLIDKPKKTKTGQFSTAEDVLISLAKEVQIIRDVLEYRGLTKLKSTYVDALPLQVASSTGRVHTDFVQTVAATGRLASNNPNLQNIPIRTERGRQVRKAFIARDENHVLLAADYSQIELRIIASLSEENNMIEAFKNREDIHTSTASKVFNIPISDVSRDHRNTAKTVNFGIIYGVSAFGLSNQTNLSRSEAKELIDTYYLTYPMLRKYVHDQIEFARENGYVQTVLGRRRYLRDINARNQMVRSAAERNAVNAPIQGSAADIIKIAMINIHNRLKKENLKTRMLLQVHDELVFDVYKPELEQIKELVQHEMENAHLLTVPLLVEIDVGQNWLEAH